MERLVTEAGQLMACGLELCAKEPIQFCTGCMYQEKVNKKLAAYESTGLTPEEVKELKSELDKLSFPVYGGEKINGKPVVSADFFEGTMTIQVAEPVTLEELKARAEAEAALQKEQTNE